MIEAALHHLLYLGVENEAAVDASNAHDPNSQLSDPAPLLVVVATHFSNFPETMS